MTNNTVQNSLTQDRLTIAKTDTTQYPIETVLQRRWSPLAFSDRMVEPEKLRAVLEAARWAASSYNEQPWSFIVATKDNPDEFNRLLSCLWPPKSPKFGGLPSLQSSPGWNLGGEFILPFSNARNFHFHSIVQLWRILCDRCFPVRPGCWPTSRC
jgi:nitroreductase